MRLGATGVQSASPSTYRYTPFLHNDMYSALHTQAALGTQGRIGSDTSSQKHRLLYNFGVSM